jgi:hypothetical protein
VTGFRAPTWLAFLGALTLSGCATLFSAELQHDDRPVTIHTLNMFNQRTQSTASTIPWRGDWMFRRERLALVDHVFLRARPDILLLQESMARRGSPTDSDTAILGAGALKDTVWTEEIVREFTDTDEIQTLAIGVAPPLKILLESPKETSPDVQDPSRSPEDTMSPTNEERSLWLVGSDGYLLVISADMEGHPLAIANLQLPSEIGSATHWYGFIQSRLEDFLRARGICHARLIVGGRLPAATESPRLTSLVETLRLKDSSDGFCPVASRCYTASPTNELFASTVSDQSGLQADRIFLPADAIVFQSERTMDAPSNDISLARSFGLTALWPTQRFGWMTETRLPRCPESSHLEATPR